MARAQASGRIAVWVSPRGDDHADGSRARPFRTLSRARDAVRSARHGGEVHLLGGTYRLTRTLVLDRRDSDVTWSAAPGAHPVISGAVRVRGWRVHDAARGIYVAPVARGLRARQLYVNGSRVTRARGALYPTGFSRTPAGFQAPDGSMAGWRNQSGIEAVTLTQWKMMRCPVGAIRGQQITMQQPCWTNVNVFPYLWSFQTLTWLENAYELLDSPGEWYLDSRAGRLYYMPRVGQRPARADVELPVVQALIDVRGTLRRPVEHIRFQGLTFAYGTWLGPSGPNGYAADQSGFHLNGYGHPSNLIGHDPDTARTPGNVRLRYARHVTFTHDDFLHLGGVGLDFDTGSRHDAIVGNRFSDISSAAVQLGGVSAVDHHPAHAGQVTSDNLISNNLITHVAGEYRDAAGIYVGFTTRSRVEHNDISHVPWSGIAIGWGWGLLDPGGFPGVPGATIGEWGPHGQPYTTPTTSRGNRIVANRIHGFLETLWDGGAIYTLGQQGRSSDDGELIAGNVASDKRRLAGGNIFYTDGGSRYVTLEHNVSFDNPPGVTDFGPCWLPDSLDICWLQIPYGSDRGGCRPYGDLTYRQNYWQYPTLFLSACPYPPYPVHVVDVPGVGQVPPSILKAAGLQRPYRSSVGAPRARRPFEAHVRFAQAGGTKIAWYERGHGPPLVMLMGTGSTMSEWDPALLRLLARSHRLILFDYPGVGLSGPWRGKSFGSLAQATARLMDAIGLAKADVLGWSMGGFVAQRLALDYPRKVSHLILAGTNPGGDKTVLGSAKAQRIDSKAYPSDRDILWELYGPAGGREGRRFLHRLERASRNGEIPDDFHVPAATTRAQVAAEDPWLRSNRNYRQLAGVAAPTLAAAGADDPVVPPVNLRRIAVQIPRSRLVVFPGAHAFLFQEGRSFTRAVNELTDTQRRRRR